MCTFVCRKLKEILSDGFIFSEAEGNVPATSEKERGRVGFENSEGLNSCPVRFLWDVYFLFALTLFHYPFSFYYIPTFNYSFLNEITASTISLVLFTIRISNSTVLL